MELIKSQWNKNHISEFENFLLSLKREEKVNWTQNIIQTKQPVLAILSPTIKDIVRQILKGNFLSFLDLNIYSTYEANIINGYLICKIKDFDLQKNYLDNYLLHADCWACCDLLKFNIKNNEERYFNLAKEYISSKETFVRRTGVIILFNYIDNDEYISQIFKILNTFTFEQEYYVNMALAWLLCECFIKRRELTYDFLESHELSTFVINKAIQKCRDSYRVSHEDKENLLKYKK